jgi:DNA-binding NtrC family response regulator
LIAPLLNQFLEESSKRLGVNVPVFTPEALDLIKSYDWPGNIRELRNVVERAVTLCDADTITPMELTLELQRSKDHYGLSCNSPVVGDVSLENSSHRLHDIVEFQERETILNSVTRNGFNLLKSAKDLGISRMTLYKKLEKYDIRRDSLHYAS